MTRRIETLYHLAEASNVASILERGLMSTAELLDLARVPEPERTTLLRGHRPNGVCLPNGLVIRDQRPMPPGALVRAPDDGLQPADWYALLNSFMLFWPDRERLERQRLACGDRPQRILTFDAAALLDAFKNHAFVSPINSGNARRKPARRGRSTLVPYMTWSSQGWPVRERSRPVAELLFACTIPAKAPYLIDIVEA
jgi:hypothetical protein